MTARRSIAATVATTAAAALAAPAAADAASITLTVPPDRVEEVPFVVTASGSGGDDLRAFARIKPVGATGCGPTYRTDADGDIVMTTERAEGSYSVGGTADVDEPGRYLLCGWLQESFSSTAAAATTAVEVDVRSAQATLSIGGPKRVRVDRTAPYTFTGATELQRWAFATVKPAGGRGCGSSDSVDPGRSFLSERVQGAFAVAGAPSRFTFDRRGRYLICAWVQEGFSDLAPEAAARRIVRVGRVSRSCRRARARLRSARRARRAGKPGSVRGVRRARQAVRRAC